jgi:Zn-dependent M28 family amino/carboxypeptidase
MSRLLREQQSKRTVRYVAFACEEPPYFNMDAMGSQHHARQARLRSDQIRGMLGLEIVGYYSTVDNSQTVPPLIPKWLRWFIRHRGDFLAQVPQLPPGCQ